MPISPSIDIPIMRGHRGIYTLPGMDTIGIRIADRLAELKKTQHWLAAQTGIKQPSINDLIRKPKGGSKHTLAIAEALGVSPRWLETGKGDPAKGAPAAPNSVPTPSPQAGIVDRIKVLGMAEAGPDGWALWNGEVVDMIPRPPVLSGALNGFAVFVVGTSMEDRYHPGEILFIHPGRPVTPGSYVLVQMRPKDGDAPRAFLKRLVKRSGDKVILEQFKPKKTFTLKAAEILSIYRVVGSSEA